MDEPAADIVSPSPTETPPASPPPAEAIPFALPVHDGPRFSVLATVCVGFVALADWLFWEQPLGWTLGAYGLLLTAAVLLWDRRWPRGRVAMLLTVAVVVLCLRCLEEPNGLTAILGALGLATLGLTLRDGWVSNGAAWVERWYRFVLLGWLCPFRDAHGAGDRWLRNWLLPVLLSLVFLVLFAVANPVITRWLQDVWGSVRGFLEGLPDWSPSASRFLMWLLVGCGAWALLRFRSGAGEPKWAPVLAGDPPATAVASPAFVARCLLLFNALFALQLGLDLRYLWGGAQLPAGLTYAQYAHRGSYPLMAAGILAAFFVFAVFRGDPCDDRMRLARRLVYVWLVQNALLLTSAAWRLWLYVCAYSLTRWRVAAAIWMLLVLCGVLWILLRICARRSNLWLVNVNVVTAAVVLYACCFGRFDEWIARFNVAHCCEVQGYGEPLDLAYLGKLGPDALPALIAFTEQTPGSPRAQEALDVSSRLRDRLNETLGNWRGWTWHRHRLAQLAGLASTGAQSAALSN